MWTFTQRVCQPLLQNEPVPQQVFGKYLLHETIVCKFYILYKMFLMIQYFKYPILNTMCLILFACYNIFDQLCFIGHPGCLFISYLNSNTENVHPLCGQLYQDKFIDVEFLHQRIVTFSQLGYMLADCFQKGGSNLLLTVVYFPINVLTLDIRTRIFIQARHKHEKKKRSNGNQSTSKLLLVMKLTCPATMMGNINGFYLPN